MTEAVWSKFLTKSDEADWKETVQTLRGQLAGERGLDAVRDRLDEGWSLLSNGNVKEAIATAKELTTRAPDNAMAWALLAEGKSRTGLTEDALYEYKRAVELEPDNAWLRHGLGDSLRRLGRLADAVEQYRAAARFEPAESEHRAALGEALLEAGDVDEALKLIEQAHKERPTDADFKRSLATGLMIKASQTWTYVPSGEDVPEGWYATSKQQIAEANSLIARAEAIGVDDAELRKGINDFKEDIANALRRRYDGGKLGTIVAGLYGLAGLFSIFSGDPSGPGITGGLYFVGSAAGYGYASMRPTYMFNREVVRRRGATVGQRAVMLAEKMGGEYAMAGIGWAMILGMIAFLPGVAAYKYHRNYIRD